MTTTAQTESRYRATAERRIGKCLTEFRMAEPDLTFHLGPHMMALLGTAELPPAAPRGQEECWEVGSSA